MARGHNSSHNGPHSTRFGGLEFVYLQQTVAATATYLLFGSGGYPPQRCRVTGFEGTMTGAGAASDTVKLQRVRGGTAVDITDTIDVSALGDKAEFEAATLDDLYWNIEKTDQLQVVTASGALCHVRIYLVPTNDS